MTGMRRWLMLDASLGLGGGLLYLALFDVLTGPLGLPQAVVHIQVGANFSYAAYGTMVFLSRTANIGYFQFLVAMNSAYAIACIIASLTVPATTVWGSALLGVEGLLIAALAAFERRWLNGEQR